MITLTRIDATTITVNSDEIETVESFHDTTITLRSGRKIIVQESSGTIIEKVVLFRRQCQQLLPTVSTQL